jgi:hypothetical protein
MNGQIVHDSIHRRDGWTVTYMLNVNGVTAGFGSIAMAGPWKNKPSIFELYVLPEHRAHAFKLFEALLTASNARFMEIQSNDVLLAVMLHTYARDVWSEKIVFRDAITTALPGNGATLQQLTSDQETWNAIAQRQGGVEYQLVLDGATVATGGLMFHYNVPYADILHGDCRTLQAPRFWVVSGPGTQTLCLRAREHPVCPLQSPQRRITRDSSEGGSRPVCAHSQRIDPRRMTTHPELGRT